VFGHLISALIGVSICKVLPELLWLLSALAVSLSIVAMQLTRTMHTPGGATALIANIGSEQIKGLGYAYVLYLVLSSVVFLLVVALLVNNLPRGRNNPYRV